MSTGNRSDALPWSPHSSSPEGWAGSLGSLVALHYATLTLGTPVNVTLEEEEEEEEQEGRREGQDKEEGAAGGGGAEEPRVVVRERVVRRVERRLAGVAHSEGQWGRGFPPKWLWAQGHLVQPGAAAAAAAAAGPAQVRCERAALAMFRASGGRCTRPQSADSLGARCVAAVCGACRALPALARPGLRPLCWRAATCRTR